MHDNNFSLLPADAPVDRRLSPTTIKALALLIMVLICGFAGKQYADTQRDQGQAVLNAAQARQDQLTLETDSVKAQLGDLVASGGKERLELVRGLLASRMNWKALFVGIADASFPGITIEGVTVNTPAPGSPAVLPLNGTAPSRGALQQLLRNFKRRDKLFSEVRLRKVTRSGDGSSVLWGIDLTVKGPDVASPAAAAPVVPVPDPTAATTP